MLLLALICPPLRPHARTGHRAWARGAGESKNLPSPRHAPGCHGDAVMIAICVLKGFFLREGHFYLFILAVLGLHCCVGFSLVAASQGLLSGCGFSLQCFFKKI